MIYYTVLEESNTGIQIKCADDTYKVKTVDSAVKANKLIHNWEKDNLENFVYIQYLDCETGKVGYFNPNGTAQNEKIQWK